MDKQLILLQLDCDAQPSVFDAVVAIDAGAQQLLRHGGVTPANTLELVHGAMFTRGAEDLRYTAIFLGGSNVAAVEQLLKAVTACFFGPVRVSVLVDPNGANTTAAAAVLAAGKHMTLKGAKALVLGGTGAVGSRVVRLLAREGAEVEVSSRNLQRSRAACEAVAAAVAGATLQPSEIVSPQQLQAALADAQLVVATGPAGIELMPPAARQQASALKVAIDVNAVPPVGIAGIEVTDRGTERDGVVCYGAIGIGGTKMKIHKASVRRLFEANDLVLDAEEIYALGGSLAK